MDFQPRVLAVTRGEELVGVIPLAVETATGRLTFGGDNMTDYRDVVTHPECREQVLIEMIRFFRAGNFPNVLHFGSTLPESESPALLSQICNRLGVHHVIRSRYGWRWWPEKATEDPVKKVSYKRNCLKRQGLLTAEPIKAKNAGMLSKRSSIISTRCAKFSVTGKFLSIIRANVGFSRK